tara:strand:- start:559 stop:975 length:417 start_codon:yes stop_codon:yes gene_type:complete
VNLLLECSTENILTALPTKLEEEEYLQDEEDDEEAAKKLRAELEDAQFPSLGAVARPKLPPPAKKKKQAANKRVTDSLASIGKPACDCRGKRMICSLRQESGGKCALPAESQLAVSRRQLTFFFSHKTLHLSDNRREY